MDNLLQLLTDYGPTIGIGLLLLDRLGILKLPNRSAPSTPTPVPPSDPVDDRPLLDAVRKLINLIDRLPVFKDDAPPK